MIRDAYISEDGKYRYHLVRSWEMKEARTRPVMWIMLNPSTADAFKDDRTIERCIAFSKSWGYSAMWVGNLFAYRSTRPSVLKLLSPEEAIGPDNGLYLQRMADRCERIVCAWGSNGLNHGIELPRSPGGWWHLGLTKHAQPKHPLYLAGNTPLKEYRPYG